MIPVMERLFGRHGSLLGWLFWEGLSPEERRLEYEGEGDMGWDDPVGPEGYVIHKHWCEGCQAYWQHDDADCPRMEHDGPEVFGVQLWAPADWPCPEHEEKEETCD